MSSHNVLSNVKFNEQISDSSKTFLMIKVAIAKDCSKKRGVQLAHRVTQYFFSK
jgi:hypothetical protein